MCLRCLFCFLICVANPVCTEYDRLRWKSLRNEHREFSYKSPGERMLKIGPHLPKLLSNIKGYTFFGTPHIFPSDVSNLSNVKKSKINMYFWTIREVHHVFMYYTKTVTRWLSGKASDLRSSSRGFEARPRRCCVTTLGKLFTPYCLCHQAV